MTSIIDHSSDRDLQVRPGELLDEFEPPDEFGFEFEIDSTPVWPADDDRLEPIFLVGPPSFEFEDSEQPDPILAFGASEAPLSAEPDDERLRLDPERGEEEPDEPPPAPRQRASPASYFGSLGIHLLPLLVLIGWSSAPAEIPNAMPVQFAFEAPPPGSAPEEATAPPGQPSPETETISAPPPDAARTAAAAPSPPVRPPPPKPILATPPPPKPSPPPEPAPRQPAPAALLTSAPPTQAASAPAPPSNPATRETQAPGPDPARSDYFARLVALTRGHLDMLPAAFLAGRRGQTVLSIVVLGDGSIGRITVKRSSGYPDIDARIEQIVAAVGSFPPPPDSFQRPSVELDFNLTFPDALPQ